MRILVLNNEYPPVGGGAAYVTQELVRKYRAQNHSITVVTMGYGTLPSFEVKQGVSVHRVPCLRARSEISRPHELLSYILSAKRFLSKHLAENQYDVCHCHFLLPAGLIALWVKKNFGLNYIVTIHGSDVPGYNPDRFRFLHRFTGPFLRNIIKGSSHLVSPSYYLLKILNNRLKIDLTHQQVIPNGIDTQYFRPVTKKDYILTSGRLLPRKGFPQLIEAGAENNLIFPIHICGDGPSIQQLKTAAKRSATKVVFHGWVANNSSEYRNLIQQAAIYVLLSSRENSSVSLLEAMACGCAIITLKSSGAGEMVKDYGILLDHPDPKKVEQELRKLIQNPDQRAYWGGKARRRVEEFYNWDTIGHSYLQLLEVARDS